MSNSKEADAIGLAASPEVRAPDSVRGQRGCDAQLEFIYRSHFVRLVRRLRVVFGNGPPEPEDVAQRTFELIAGVDTLTSINNIEAYLWTSAKNVRLSELRSRIASEARGAEYSALFSYDDGYHFSAERVFLAEEDIEIAVKTIEAMPEARRRAFVIVRLQGLSHQQAAEQLGVSRPAISKHVARATLDLHNAVSNAK